VLKKHFFIIIIINIIILDSMVNREFNRTALIWKWTWKWKLVEM